MDTRKRTWTNGAIGAVITFILFFVPVIGLLSPLFGGGVSGFLQGDGPGGGAVAGIAMAVCSGVPAFALGVAGLALGSVPLLSDSVFLSVIGGVGALGGLFVLALWFAWTVYALMLGLIGGVIGGVVAGE